MDIAHIRSYSKGVRDLVSDGEYEKALKVTSYLQREGQKAIVDLGIGDPTDFYPAVVDLLDAIGDPKIAVHPKLRYTVAKTMRLFMQLVAHKLAATFPEEPIKHHKLGVTFPASTKKYLLEEIKPRIQELEETEEYGLMYELTCFRESVKGLDTGIPLFSKKLAFNVIKGSLEFGFTQDPSTLKDIILGCFEKMGKLRYADALHLSWLGVMTKNDKENFPFFVTKVAEYIDKQPKVIDLSKQYVCIGLVDTFAEIAWTSTIPEHRDQAIGWIAEIAHKKQAFTFLKMARYRAFEQLVSIKEWHLESKVRSFATDQLKIAFESTKDKLVPRIFEKKKNTGFQERPNLVSPPRDIDRLLESETERGVAKLREENKELRTIVEKLRNTVENLHNRSSVQQLLLTRASRREMKRLFNTSNVAQKRKLKALFLQIYQIRRENKAQRGLNHGVTTMSVRFGIETRLTEICNKRLTRDQFLAAKLLLKQSRSQFGLRDDLTRCSWEVLEAILFQWNASDDDLLGYFPPSMTPPPGFTTWWVPEAHYNGPRRQRALLTVAQIGAHATPDLLDLMSLSGYATLRYWSPISKGYEGTMKSAVEHQNHAMVSHLIDKGMSIDDFYEDLKSPLQLFSFWGNLKLMRFVLDHGADPNHTYSQDLRLSKPPVMWAVLRGGSDALKLLIESGGKIDQEHPDPTAPHSPRQRTFNLLDLALGDGYPAFVPTDKHLKCAQLLKAHGLRPSRPGSRLRELRSTWIPYLDLRPKLDFGIRGELRLEESSLMRSTVRRIVDDALPFTACLWTGMSLINPSLPSVYGLFFSYKLTKEIVEGRIQLGIRTDPNQAPRGLSLFDPDNQPARGKTAY